MGSRTTYIHYSAIRLAYKSSSEPEPEMGSEGL